MKVPLRYQVTEYDCGTTSFINALTYLYEREEIPVELLKCIQCYTLDVYGSEYDQGSGGTSRESTSFLNGWINNYSKKRNYDLKSTKLICEKVNRENITKYLKERAVIVVRYFMMGEHYSLITKEDEDNIYLFDPYYIDKDIFEDKDIKVVFDNQFEYNRIIKKERFYSKEKKDYTLGEFENSECICLYRKKD